MDETLLHLGLIQSSPLVGRFRVAQGPPSTISHKSSLASC